MSKFSIVFSFALMAALLAAAGTTVPRAVHSGRLLAAADDPARLSDLALEKEFDAAVAAREIAAALAADQIELAQSLVQLARERAIGLHPVLIARGEAGRT